jgi:hypothetical protein
LIQFSEELDMQDEARTKEQLRIELKALRQRVAELEKAQGEEALRESEARRPSGNSGFRRTKRFFHIREPLSNPVHPPSQFVNS